MQEDQNSDKKGENNLNKNASNSFNLNEEILSELWSKYKNVKKISEIIGRSIVKSRVLSNMIMPYVLEDVVNLSRNISLSYSQIAQQVGLGNNALRNWMKNHNLEEKFDLPYRPSVKPRSKRYDKYVLIKAYFSLDGINVLKKTLKSSSMTLKKELEKLGFETNGKIINRTKLQKHVLKKDFTFNYTPFMQELIYGAILGDGCVNIQNNRKIVNHTVQDYKDAITSLKYLVNLSLEVIKNSNLNQLVGMYNKSAKIISEFPTGFLTYSTNQKEYTWLNFIADTFENHGLSTNRFFSEGQKSEINGRKIKSGKVYTIQINECVELAKIAMEWYIIMFIEIIVFHIMLFYAMHFVMAYYSLLFQNFTMP